MAKVTIRDVARIAGVSVGTVSQTLNNNPKVTEETRRKVLDVIERLGYRPNIHARRLNTGSTGNIGIMFAPTLGELSDRSLMHPFYSALHRQFDETASKYGYNLMYVYIKREMVESGKLPDVLELKEVDGVITVGPFFDKSYIYKIRDNANVPVVLIDETAEGKGICSVSSDSLRGGYEAGSYLTGLGHKEIAFIGSSEDIVFNKRRFAGLRAALDEADIILNPKLTVYGGYTLEVEDGERLTEELCRRGEAFTAIFAVSDLVAIGACRYLKSKGIRVPEDVSVIGFDDIEMSEYVEPPLTTIHSDRNIVANTAIEALVKAIKKGEFDKPRKDVPVRLVVRKSCAPQNSVEAAV